MAKRDCAARLSAAAQRGRVGAESEPEVCAIKGLGRWNLEVQLIGRVVWRKSKIILHAIFVAIPFAYPAWAWFAEAHEIIAVVAADVLRPSARVPCGAYSRHADGYTFTRLWQMPQVLRLQLSYPLRCGQHRIKIGPYLYAGCSTDSSFVRTLDR